jgi:hypothetical protein
MTVLYLYIQVKEKELGTGRGKVLTVIDTWSGTNTGARHAPALGRGGQHFLAH